MSGVHRAPVGVVLAGGESRRMGRDKATLELGGQSLAAAAARCLAAVCAEVVIADRGRGIVPGLPSVVDGAARGPAAGILGAAGARPGRDLLVLACDLPGVVPALLAELARPGPWDLALPSWGAGVEPLCALYRPAALLALARRAETADVAPRHLLTEPALRIRLLSEEELRCVGDPAALFRNLNRPEDLERD